MGSLFHVCFNPRLPDARLTRRDTPPRNLRRSPRAFARLLRWNWNATLRRSAVSTGSASLGARSIEVYDADALIWWYMFAGPFATLDEFTAYLRGQVEAENGLALCVFDLNTDRQIGVANYMNNFPEHLKVELGSIWYSPLAQRTPANTEATYLMLSHAFELGYRRVGEMDAPNDARAVRPAHGPVRAFRSTDREGRNRDTAWFRISTANGWKSERIWNGRKCETVLRGLGAHARLSFQKVSQLKGVALKVTRLGGPRAGAWITGSRQRGRRRKMRRIGPLRGSVQAAVGPRSWSGSLKRAIRMPARPACSTAISRSARLATPNTTRLQDASGQLNRRPASRQACPTWTSCCASGMSVRTST
jgi:hypothetical protein